MTKISCFVGQNKMQKTYSSIFKGTVYCILFIFLDEHVLNNCSNHGSLSFLVNFEKLCLSWFYFFPISCHLSSINLIPIVPKQSEVLLFSFLPQPPFCKLAASHWADPRCPAPSCPPIDQYSHWFPTWHFLAENVSPAILLFLHFYYYFIVIIKMNKKWMNKNPQRSQSPNGISTTIRN